MGFIGGLSRVWGGRVLRDKSLDIFESRWVLVEYNVFYRIFFIV